MGEYNSINRKLWDAAWHGDCATIRQLVMAGVDLDARDPQDRTALNIATQQGQTEAIKTLLAAREARLLGTEMPDIPASKAPRKLFGKRKAA